ncbi:MAG: hypothetical protein K9G70_04420 [Prolixibacteraceae bacterium]|nr:hypothetical protein [Prolixibacteraceae bacterium]
MDIQKYISMFNAEWKHSEDSFNLMTDVVDCRQKLKNEAIIIDAVTKAEKRIKYSAKNAIKETIAKDNNLHSFRDVFAFNDFEFDLIRRISDKKVTTQFVEMALRFDPDVEMEDVFQAGRNLWIINSLQLLMDLPVELSDSVFAYCMLYPYTDDYLDNKNISRDEKIDFSKRFRLRLQGESVLAQNELEEKIFRLVSFIESDWPRSKYPKVFESLVGIHDAQTRSIGLVNRQSISQEELMSICIDKGGASVLADGYLLKGDMSYAEEVFCFGFGVYLQYVDDIQDLQEDIRGQVKTVFTNAVEHGCIDEYINKTISFGERLMSRYLKFSSSSTSVMRGLMLKSIHYLLIEAVCLNAGCLPESYLLEYKKYAPFTFDFIREKRDRMKKDRISSRGFLKKYFKKEKELAFEA